MQNLNNVLTMYIYGDIHLRKLKATVYVVSGYVFYVIPKTTSNDYTNAKTYLADL